LHNFIALAFTTRITEHRTQMTLFNFLLVLDGMPLHSTLKAGDSNMAARPQARQTGKTQAL